MNQPNLVGDVTQKTDQYFRQLVAEVQTLAARLGHMEQSKPLTQEQAQQLYAPSALVRALQSNGNAPLNVTGLTGRLAQPQGAAIPTVTALPSYNDPLSQDGTLIYYADKLYRFDQTRDPGTWQIVGAVGVILEDSHANRANYDATGYPLDSVFYESDRKVFYRVALSGGVKVWTYLTGVCPLAFAAKPADLGVNDTGFLWDVTDYAHRLMWTGAGWQSAPGTVWDAGKVEGFIIDPDPVVGWHLCDGALNVPYLKKDGTLGSTNLPDFVTAPGNAAYMKFGSPAGSTVNAAVAPTLVMNSYTPQGTVSQPGLTINSYTPQGTVSQPVFVGAALPTHKHRLPISLGSNVYLGGASLWGTAALTGYFEYKLTSAGSGLAGDTAVTLPYDEPISGGTPSGTVSQPAFIGTPATLTGTVAQPTFTGTPATLTGTISATAEPRNFIFRPWFRQ